MEPTCSPQIGLRRRLETETMSEKQVRRQTERLTFAINGLACGGGGSLSAERALAKVPGVLVVYVNPATEMAYVEYDPQLMDTAQLVAAVERTGLRVAELKRR